MPELNDTILSSFTKRTNKYVKNLVGQTFGQLLVYSYLGTRLESGHWRGYWLCRCTCGKFTIRQRPDSHTVGCGCTRIKHGATGTRSFITWCDMMRRCYEPAHVSFHRYGGRGIKVCDRWHQWADFLADMGEREEDMTIERVNNDGNYEPSNCKWADMFEQARNRSNNHLVTYQNETMTITEWEERHNLPKGTVNNRINYGWEITDAITFPISHQKYYTRKKLVPPISNTTI